MPVMTSTKKVIARFSRSCRTRQVDRRQQPIGTEISAVSAVMTSVPMMAVVGAAARRRPDERVRRTRRRARDAAADHGTDQRDQRHHRQPEGADHQAGDQPVGGPAGPSRTRVST
jgi:hypothetical protein